MPEILPGDQIPEQRIEGSNVLLPDYTAKEFSDEEVAENRHRSFVIGAGGDWDQGGEDQQAFLVKHGLQPHHKVVDIGCGALRLGRRLSEYLDPGNYYGVDANRDLITIGYNRELTDHQRSRLPIENLRANDRFDTDFGVTFDFAMAQSVFTHVSLNHVLLCLHRLEKVMAPGGVFFASICVQPNATPVDHIYQRHPKGRTYFYEKNVFWYRRQDMRWAASTGNWRYAFVGEYGSPQGQRMVSFTKLTDGEIRARDEAAASAAEREKAQRALDRAARERAKQVDAAIAAGGARSFILRARRKAARALNPY